MRSPRWLLPFALTAAAAIPACASRPVPARAAVAPEAAGSEQGADWAVLHEPLEGGALRFSLARPGYVAVFSIVPGEGVRLLYPAGERQNVRIERGSYTRTTRRELGADRRMVRLGGGFVPEVRYLYLVASSRPLRLEEPLRWPGGGRFTGASLGGVPLDPEAIDVTRTLEALFDLVVPDVELGEVDTDVYAYYPDVRFRRGGRTVALSAFRCFDGRVVYAPAYYGEDYFPSSWYGVDFYGDRYVGSDCYLGYFAGGTTGGVTGGGTLPTPAPGGRSRLTPQGMQARDIRPRIPLDPDQLRPVVPAPGATTENGPNRLESGARRPLPGFEPRTRAPERIHEAPAPRSSETRERTDSPRAAPAPRAPVHAEPSRPEPVRSAPPRAEPRSEPARSEPVRSEPARSEPSEGSARTRPQTEGSTAVP